MNLDLNKEDFESAADALADISKFIEHAKEMVSNEFLFDKEEFVQTLDQLATVFDLLITAGTTHIETQFLIEEIENTP